MSPRGELAELHPAYFAIVMATGIVSIAARLVGLPGIPSVLFALNCALYVIVWALLVARVIRYRDRVRADLLHPGRAVGFFTAVAATCVLGSQCLIIGEAPRAALALWTVGIGLWALLTYSIFTILTVKTDKPTLAEGINGGWLVSVVAAQSVAAHSSQWPSGWS